MGIKDFTSFMAKYGFLIEKSYDIYFIRDIHKDNKVIYDFVLHGDVIDVKDFIINMLIRLSIER